MEYAHRQLEAEFWTTKFAPLVEKERGEIYTVNHFYFKTTKEAEEFYGQVDDALDKAIGYEFNDKEPLFVLPWKSDNTVIIIYGKERWD
jgi:hypothetical protein